MTPLGKAAVLTRKIIVFGLPTFILIMIITLTLASVLKRVNPVVIAPKPTPSVLFGPLTPLVFPPSKQFPTDLKLETVSGIVPISTDTAKVYFIPQKPTNVFSRKNALEFATNFGFSPPYDTLDEKMYKFTSQEGNTLTLDITNNNFVYTNQSKPYLTAGEVDVLDESIAIQEAKRFFTKLKIWDNAFDTQKVTYFDIVNGQNIPVKNPNDAVVSRVDFFKSKIEGNPIVTALKDTSSTYIIYSGTTADLLNVYQASYQNWEPDTTMSATYPTISGQIAWEQLLSNIGYVQSINENNTNQTVRDGYFAYFAPDEYSLYLQPVYVFTGDDDLTIFVPAIDPAWLQN